MTPKKQMAMVFSKALGGWAGLERGGLEWRFRL